MTDYTVYQDLVMVTSVYLVSYDGLLVKTTPQKTVYSYVYLHFNCVEKIKKKSSRSCPCLSGGFHCAQSKGVSSVPH